MCPFGIRKNKGKNGLGVFTSTDLKELLYFSMERFEVNSGEISH
jgi:hypothetical protein